MPAVSKAQQRFMGMVHATQKGDMETPSKDVKTVAKSISKKDAKDFASTPHKGLPDNIKEMILSELRSIGVIQKEYFSVIDDIKKTLSAYKDNKGTDKEKQIVSKLKLLNDKKKKLSDEMDGKVSSMYKDAELKVDEASTTASADGYATPYAFSKPNQTKNKNNKLARVSGGTLVDDLDESVNENLNESEITPLLIKGLVGILAAGGAAVVKVVARTLVDRVIDGAILTYHDIKNIVAPEPYIKFLKELQKNDKFNKEFIGIILSDKTGEASYKLFRILSGDMPALQSFVEAFDKFTSQQNISGDDKKSLLRKIQNRMAMSYMFGWRDVHKNLKKK